MRARGLTVPLLCSLAIVAGAPAALAGGTSLYSGPGPRPGPDVLYGAPAVAPQLENVGVWSAAPILVSGASAYRGGEFLYQDFLYDDHGAAEVPDPTDPKGGGNLFSKPDGTYTYPTDPAHAEHVEGCLAGGLLDRHRRHARRAPILPRGRERPGARRPLPHRTSCRDEHGRRPGGRRHRAARRWPRSAGRGRHRPPPDRGACAARGLESRQPGGPPGRRRGPVGQGERSLPAAAGRGQCDPP